MRRKVAIITGALALLAASAPAWAGPFHRSPCCGDCPQPRYCLKAEVEERVCTVETPVKNPVVVKTKVTEKDAPCTRMVPVCVGDPHCGGTHTELRPQTVPGKVRHISIEVCPPEKEWGVKKEDKVERCITITIQRLPEVVPTPAPCPTGPAH
jgi:hypothetical protein